MSFDPPAPVPEAAFTPIGLADPVAMQRQLLQAEHQLKQDELERLKLEDPEAYEQLIHDDLDTNHQQVE